ncbi:MAG: alpha/beta fold hydrolase [Thermoleophilaceae bacterium]
MNASAPPETQLVEVATGIRMNYRRVGSGDPLLMVMGTSGSLGLWGAVEPGLTEAHEVISFDNRGLGASERGEGELSIRSMAGDTAALLDALGVERAHVCGWSLRSAVAQELALAHPDRVGALVLYGTWGRVDGFQTALLAALSHPWETGDLEAALTALGLAFSPELLSSPEFEALMEQLRPLFPSTEAQIAATARQWRADLEHDTLDRLHEMSAPTLVVAGEQDLVTPPWQCRAVADRIPGARYECLSGPGSSHALAFERTEEFVALVRGFLAEQRL